MAQWLERLLHSQEFRSPEAVEMPNRRSCPPLILASESRDKLSEQTTLLSKLWLDWDPASENKGEEQLRTIPDTWRQLRSPDTHTYACTPAADVHTHMKKKVKFMVCMYWKDRKQIKNKDGKKNPNFPVQIVGIVTVLV